MGNLMAQLIDSVRDSLRLAKEQEKRLLEVIGHLEQSLKLLEAEVQMASASVVVQGPEAIQATTPKDNLKAIMVVIRANGGPMRRKDITRNVIKQNLILSKSGPGGIDPIVGNILSRNEPRLFINTGWGWWDLAKCEKRGTLTISLPSAAPPAVDSD